MFCILDAVPCLCNFLVASLVKAKRVPFTVCDLEEPQACFRGKHSLVEI